MCLTKDDSVMCRKYWQLCYRISCSSCLRQGCSNLDSEMGILLSGDVSTSESVWELYHLYRVARVLNFKTAVCFIFLFRSPKIFWDFCSLGDSGGSVFQIMEFPPL